MSAARLVGWLLTTVLCGGAVSSLAEPSAGLPATATKATTTATAADDIRVRLDEDVITGNSELPKVLYILPWRSADPTVGLDAAPILKASELFEPLDPDAHGRLLQFRQRLVGEPVEAP